MEPAIDEFLVTNLDDGEKYRVDDVIEAFKIVRINDSSETNNSGEAHQLRQSFDGSNSSINNKMTIGNEEEEEDSKQFDAKYDSATGLPLNVFALASYGEYQPVYIPNDTCVIEFYRISAVGTTRDLEDKPFSVYYLDIHCNDASPKSWYVHRRYSQFRRLSDILRNEGYMVPVLPPKKILGTFTIDFVKQRKADLEIWLIALIGMHINYPGSKNPMNHPYFRNFLVDNANKPPPGLKLLYPENPVTLTNSTDEITTPAVDQAKRSKVIAIN